MGRAEVTGVGGLGGRGWLELELPELDLEAEVNGCKPGLVSTLACKLLEFDHLDQFLRAGVHARLDVKAFFQGVRTAQSISPLLTNIRIDVLLLRAFGKVCFGALDSLEHSEFCQFPNNYQERLSSSPYASLLAYFYYLIYRTPLGVERVYEYERVFPAPLGCQVVLIN